MGTPGTTIIRSRWYGVRAEDTWMVADYLDFDVAGAQQLGMLDIWVDRLGAGLPAGCVVRPDRIIRTLTELESAARRPAAR